MEFSQLSPEESCRPVSVHPLVVLSISDHVTRMDYVAFQRTATGKASAAAVAATESNEGGGDSTAAEHAFRDTHPLAPVLGILLGERQPTSSRTAVDIVASFEVVLKGATDELVSLPHPPAKRFRAGEESSPDAPTSWSYLQEDRLWYVEHVDWRAVSDMCEQLCRVHPEMQPVGWYTVGSEVGDVATCAHLHAHVKAIVEEYRARRRQQSQDQEADERGQTGPTPAAARSGKTTQPDRMAGADGEESGEATEGDLFAVVLDARMSDAHAKLPVHAFTVRTRDATTTAAEVGADPSSSADLHLETSACGFDVVSRTLAAEPSLAPASGDTHAQTVVTFALTRLHIESEEIEHIGVDSAMNVELQTKRVRLSDEALAAKAMTAFTQLRTRQRVISQNELALVRQALQTPADLVPSVARLSQALQVLRRRVQLLVLFLEDIEKAGVRSVVEDDCALREVASVCARLPCTPPTYPHTHWNDIRTQQQQQLDVTASPCHQEGAKAVPDTAAVLPRAVRGHGTVNAVVEEHERAFVTALLTAQTKLVLEVRPMKDEQTRTSLNAYRVTADTKRQQREEAQNRAREHDGKGRLSSDGLWLEPRTRGATDGYGSGKSRRGGRIL